MLISNENAHNYKAPWIANADKINAKVFMKAHTIGIHVDMEKYPVL